MFETLIYRLADGVGEIRLNRPACLNALCLQSYADLGAALERAGADPTVRAILIAGEGRSFCVGADIKEFQARPESQEALIEAEQDLARRLAALSKPVVAAIRGHALGAGAELALGCDFILMAKGARFGLPEIGLGNFLGGGASHILPRLVGLAKAREMVFLGQLVEAEEALAIGLANQCLDAETFEDEALAFARRLAAQAPLPMRLARAQLNRVGEWSFEAVLAAEAEGMRQCLASRDWQEGLRALTEKRPPRFTGE